MIDTIVLSHWDTRIKWYETPPISPFFCNMSTRLNFFKLMIRQETYNCQVIVFGTYWPQVCVKPDLLHIGEFKLLYLKVTCLVLRKESKSEQINLKLYMVIANILARFSCTCWLIHICIFLLTFLFLLCWSILHIWRCHCQFSVPGM